MKLFKIKPILIKKAESIIKVKNFDAKQHKYCKAGKINIEKCTKQTL